MITTCILATLGGSIKPLSSLWINTKVPMDRVDIPQDVWYTNCEVLFLSRKFISNILEKFYPSMWEVAAWIPLPFYGTYASTVVVKSAPPNF